MKKTIGVIIIVIVTLNIITLMVNSSKGKFESPIYYIFIVGLLILGIWMVSNIKKDKES